MRRTLFLMALACLWTVTNHAGSPAPERHFKSPNNDLSYSFDIREDAPESKSWYFRIRSASGDLLLTVRPGASEFATTTEMASGGPRSSVVYSRSDQDAVGELQIQWAGRRDRARFLDRGEGAGLTLVAGDVPDCEERPDKDLAATQARLLKLAEEELARHLDPPRHLAALVAGLRFATVPPMIAANCEPSVEPSAGRCYYDYANHTPCVQCCESATGIKAVICMTVFRSICPTPICIGAGTIACGGLVDLESSICAKHNCRGKPGDPLCDEFEPCEGTCMSFCGPGHSAACGDCGDSGPHQTACCD